MRKLIPLSDPLEPLPEETRNSEHPWAPSEEDDRSLKDHLREHGQLTSIVMIGDKVLNGRRRIKSLRELKAEGAIDPSTGKVFEFVVADVRYEDTSERVQFI